jgi:hypothetical protein
MVDVVEEEAAKNFTSKSKKFSRSTESWERDQTELD